jgi:hypothetical protein
MYDNLLKQKILEKILYYKSMFFMKKEAYFNLDNLHEFFDKEKRFDTALISLLSEEYITLKKDNGFKKVNIEEKGVFAINNNTFKKENRKLMWSYTKDGGMLLATFIMTLAAVIALQRDTSKFADKHELKEIQQQLILLRDKVSQENRGNNQVCYPTKDSIHHENETLIKDTLVIKVVKKPQIITIVEGRAVNMWFPLPSREDSSLHNRMTYILYKNGGKATTRKGLFHRWLQIPRT